MKLNKTMKQTQRWAGWAAMMTAMVMASTVVGGAEVGQPATSVRGLGDEFIKNAKVGIFVHYTVEYAHLSPGKPQPAVWDLDAKADAFDVKAFADAVEGMGAPYVTLTSFHAAMYLLAPSKVMRAGIPVTAKRTNAASCRRKTPGSWERKCGSRRPRCFAAWSAAPAAPARKAASTLP